MNAPPPPQLHYAPASPGFSRLHRRLLYLTTAAVLIASSYFWLPVLKLRAQLLYWQHRCMTYTAGPDAVVYDDLREAKSPVPQSVSGVVPQPWARFYALHSPPGFRSKATLFLHRRVRPDGAERLVAVDLFLVPSSPQSIAAAAVRVFEPGSLTRVPRTSSSPNPSANFSLIGGAHTVTSDVFYTPTVQPKATPPMSLRFFAGQPDPADPSHFTIDYEDPAGRHTLDGWLQNDDTVLLQPRRPPTTNN
jgi:hypothetical protein